MYLTRENSELREQNELLRQMLASEMPAESTSTIDRFQAENAALKLALYESVQNLTKHQNARSMFGSGPQKGANVSPVKALRISRGSQMSPLSGFHESSVRVGTPR